jgi:aminoglycoside phosphotransferase family enzyme/predicted kinase
VYLGVVAIVGDARGRLAFVPAYRAGEQPVLEWAVHMRRLPDEARADVRLARGSLDRAELEAIAQLLVRFHRSARSDAAIAAFGSVQQVSQNVEENFSQVAQLPGAELAPDQLAMVERYQREFLRKNAALFAARAASGCVRDGHGDLRLEHIYRIAPDQHVIVDCIEFNDRFRFADVCADLAFLSMDLRYHGRADLAELLIAAYARGCGDYGLYGLIDFYESYRAFVRAKVAALLACDAEVSQAARERAQTSARRYYLLALSAARPALARRRLIATMGQIASGKSTLAEALATRLGLCVLSADRVRKELLGVDARTPLHDAAFSGAYTPELSARVYATLRERATLLLRSGRSVILDATFRERRQREMAAGLALELGAEALFLECRCPRELTRERLRARARGPSVSDGRMDVYDAVARSSEPTTELPAGSHLVLDTSAPLEATLARALQYVR